ncbi:hypothetical protein [Vulcanisaeta sp. JCM 16161]
MGMGYEKEQRWTGNTITDCFLTWVEILERKERKGRTENKGGDD